MRAIDIDQICGVYLLEHLPSGKIYVGSSIDIRERLVTHVQKMRMCTTNSIEMQTLYHQDGGRDAFKACVLEECSADKLQEREAYWIAQYDPDSMFNVFKQIDPNARRGSRRNGCVVR